MSHIVFLLGSAGVVDQIIHIQVEKKAKVIGLIWASHDSTYNFALFCIIKYFLLFHLPVILGSSRRQIKCVKHFYDTYYSQHNTEHMTGIQPVLISEVQLNGREISRWIDFFWDWSKGKNVGLVQLLHLLTEYVSLSLRPVLANEL